MNDAFEIALSHTNIHVIGNWPRECMLYGLHTIRSNTMNAEIAIDKIRKQELAKEGEPIVLVEESGRMISLSMK